MTAAAAPIAAAPATLRRRLAALAYESMLAAALLLLAGFALSPLIATGGPATGDRTLHIPGLPERVILFAALFGVLALYFCWSWTAGRRTLPMKTWKLWLTTRDGGPLEMRTALIRYFAGWIGPVLALAAYAALKPMAIGTGALWLLCVNYVWALVDRDRAFLHDRIAGTRLVADLAPAVPQAK